MAGHGEWLTRKQEQAIAALLAQPTLDRAAAACEVNERTLRRWLKEHPFVAAYRAARRQVVEQAIGQLQQLSRRAVKALRRNLACGKPAVEVAAAFGVLDRALKAVELVDLLERVEELERRDQARKDREKQSR